jgi:hypothetical protein
MRLSHTMVFPMGYDLRQYPQVQHRHVHIGYASNRVMTNDGSIFRELVRLDRDKYLLPSYRFIRQLHALRKTLTINLINKI